jgi:hypothetical protein
VEIGSPTVSGGFRDVENATMIEAIALIMACGIVIAFIRHHKSQPAN